MRINDAKSALTVVKPNNGFQSIIADKGVCSFKSVRVRVSVDLPIDQIKAVKADGLSIFWISFTRLDTDLHSMSLLNIVKQLTELGNRVSLIATHSKSAPKISASQLRVFSVPLRGIQCILPLIFTGFLFLYLPVYTAISKVDVIIIDPYVDILSVFPGLLICKIKRIKLVLDIRSTPVETAGIRGFLRRFWFNVAIHVAKRFFNGMTVITPLMKEEVCRTFKIDDRNVGTWPSGVDTNLFDPERYVLKGVELKKSLGLTKKFVVFYHGVLTATRGLEKTVESIKLLKAQYPNVVLFFLGSGAFEPRLRQLISDDELQKNIVIHSPVDQTRVPEFISMSDVCIVPLPNHPYWRSQSPLKLMEYLSMGKVVILSDLPAHKAIVREEKCGVFLSMVEPKAISKAIEHTYCCKDLLIGRGIIGRRIALENFTWAQIALGLENHLKAIKDGKKNIR